MPKKEKEEKEYLSYKKLIRNLRRGKFEKINIEKVGYNIGKK